MKKHKKFFVFAVIASIIGGFMVTNLALGFVNYSKNKDVQLIVGDDAYIHYQRANNEFRYGLFNFGYNGCGCVAIYNTLVKFNKQKPLAEIIRSMDFYGSILLGTLGTSPLPELGYLQRQGLDCALYTDVNIFEEKMIESKVNILVYFSFSGGHTWMAESYDAETKLFKMLNPDEYISIDYIKNLKSENGLFLITVN